MKLHGLCGVRQALLPPVQAHSVLTLAVGPLAFDSQDEQVYVSDPKALYHIVIKDQDVYEETEYFIQYVVIAVPFFLP